MHQDQSESGLPYSDRPWLASYAEGVPADIDEPTQTLVDMLDASVRRFGSKVALEFFGAQTSYRELGEQVSRAAEGLRRLGVGPGDRVALVLPNCPQHVVAFYAALRLGAIVIEHNPLYTARELRHQFEDHGAGVAIVWDKVYDLVADMPSDVKLAHIVSVDMTDALPFGKRLALRLPLKKARESRAAMTATPRARRVFTWERLARRASRLSRRIARPTLDDTALLQYTSGTTGTPKGAILTHRNLRANAAQGRAWVPGLARGRRDLLRSAAALPRLRHDALPDLRHEHRCEARAVPQVRPRPRARRHEEVAADLPARRAADLRRAGAGDEPEGRRPDQHPFRDLGSDEPAGLDGRRAGRRRPAVCSSRATG